MATILVIDDDPPSREIFVALLTPFGHQILQAQDGRQGLKVAQAQKPDLIVSDILMPTMNGYEFVNAARKLPELAATPIIFQSASFLQHERRAVGSACGISDFIDKPCDPEMVLTTVNRVLGISGGSQAAPPPLPTHQDPLPSLLDSFYYAGKQLDAVSARLAALLEIAQNVSSSTEPKEMLEKILAKTRKVVGANYAAIGILDGKGPHLRHFLSSGSTTNHEDLDAPPVAGVFGRILAERKTTRTRLESGPGGAPSPGDYPISIRGFLGVPVQTAASIYGWLYVTERLETVHFTSEDEQILETIAAQIAVAYENLLRYQNTLEHAARLEHEIERRSQAEERFRLLVETAPTGILICDGQGNITEANLQLQRIFGYTRDELVGKSIEMLVPEPLREVHATLRQEYATHPRVRPMKPNLDLFGRRKDGTEFPAEISLAPLNTGSGMLISAMIMDISDRKKMEQQLRVSQRLESVGQLAAGIAHDFNNILTAISGNTKLALSDLPVGHPVQQNLEEIDKAAKRATKVVRQILSFSRQEPAKREAIAIASVVDEAIKLLRASLRANISLEAEYAPDLPLVLADPTQIHQIVMNLATNAADAIGEKQGVLKLQLATVEVDSASAAPSHPGLAVGRYIRLSMSDNGCGMDERTASRIFEPFFTTKPLGQGTGLGLSVIHGIVQQHGGAITADSKPGQGTTFFVYLPVAGEVASAGPRPSRGEVPRGHGENILYVDDEEPLVFLATRILERLGYQVTGCTDPEKALALFRANPKQFDAVVSDLSMPSISGMDLARECLRIRPGIPIMIASGYIRTQDNEYARELGVPDLLLKPDTIEEFGRILHRVFTKAKSTSQH